MLTESQYKTLQFIEGFFVENGYAPTIAEIAPGIGIKSRSAVHRNLKAIESAGYIEIVPNKRRNIVLIKEAVNDTTIPLLGEIAAGKPIEALDNKEQVDINQLFVGSKRFLLRVKGESMIEDNICDGDLVVCEQKTEFPEGKIVIALVDNADATLKRIYYKDDGTVILKPSNHTMAPMIYGADRVTIQGIYIGLLRLELNY
jgi:repressor LexA